MRVQVDQASGPRDRRVIRGVLLQPNPHKLPQRQRVRQSPGYPTLTVDALEISNQQTPKVDPRRQRRPPELRRIELRAPPKPSPPGQSRSLPASLVACASPSPWAHRTNNACAFFKTLSIHASRLAPRAARHCSKRFIEKAIEPNFPRNY